MRFLTFFIAITFPLFGNLPEIESISDLNSCFNTLEQLLHKKVQQSDRRKQIAAKKEVEAFFAELNSARKTASDFPSTAWNIYPKFIKAYHTLSVLKPSLDDTFQTQGYVQGVVNDTALWQRLFNHMPQIKNIPFFEEDCAPNYCSTPLAPGVEELLNTSHEYCLIEPIYKAILRDIFERLKDPVYKALGTPWRIVNVRMWKTPPSVAEVGPNEWHYDGFPHSALKIMLYPYGVNPEIGTLEFKTGSKVQTINGIPGTWVLFKNSEIFHRATAPQQGKRWAIEITLVPSLEFDLEPHCAGLNARHPILPWQKSYSVARIDVREAIGLNINGGLNWSQPGWINLDSSSPPFFSHCDFPFENNSVQMAYTSEALCCQTTAAIYRILSETHRTLQQGGNFIIKMPDYDKALDCWLSEDMSFFGPEWNIESVSHLWPFREICDCLDHRAAMIFTSFWNQAFTKKELDETHPPYFGPPIVDTPFLRQLIAHSTPSQICKELCKAVKTQESDYHLFHRSAWSRKELTDLLNHYGFEIVSFDREMILSTFNTISQIEDQREQSLFCWARKK